MTWARSSKRELVPPWLRGCPGDPKPPACPGLRSSTTLPTGVFRVPVPGWDRQCAFRGGCPLIRSLWRYSPPVPRRAGRFPRCCRLQPGSSPHPSLLPPKICGDCSNSDDPGSPERSGKQEGSAPAKEKAAVICGGSGVLLLPHNFPCRVGEPVRKRWVK